MEKILPQPTLQKKWTGTNANSAHPPKREIYFVMRKYLNKFVYIVFEMTMNSVFGCTDTCLNSNVTKSTKQSNEVRA